MTARNTPDRSKRFEFPNGAVGFPAAIKSNALAGLPFAAVYFCPVEGTSLALTCYGTGAAQLGAEGARVPACTKHRKQHITGTLKTDPLGNVSFVPSPSHMQRMKG